MCSYCEFLGQGNTYLECINAVIEHEKTCEEKKAQED
jgi:hypothetical protein